MQLEGQSERRRKVSNSRQSKWLCALVLFGFISLYQGLTWAGIDGSISGNVSDTLGLDLSSVPIKLLNAQGALVKTVTTSVTGDYQFFPVVFGDYEITVNQAGYTPFSEKIRINSGQNTELKIQLQPENKNAKTETSKGEMVLNVRAKKHLIQNSTSSSSTEISQDQIKTMPKGDEISLPKLLTTTMPGAVEGPFGQIFFRGNHANIQYQIDGIQMPDSPSNTFGQAFSPRNIDRMEVITGGIPAEYGERLAAVVNIVTKSGPETPGGEMELNYGTYSTFSPHILYGGSNPSGSVHYFFSANYMTTQRGLDTPQPKSESDQKQGGTDAIHDKAHGNGEFAKIDWLMDNDNKLSFVLFNSSNFYQIPNYPSSFQSTDAFFQARFSDQFGNGGNPNGTTFNFVPFDTDDWQKESNSYIQAIWKHTFNETSFLQLAPYFKFSSIYVNNDPTNDLASGAGGATPIANSSPSSFFEDRINSNAGLKGDYTLRYDEDNLLKAGFQVQESHATGKISVQTALATPPTVDTNPDTGFFESLYLQDDYKINKEWALNAGLRFDATQFNFAGSHPTDADLQPRLGLNYLVTDKTKLHVFYGRLFQPAPVENLRDTFGGGQLAPYDIKAEKDNYYEIGVAQELSENQVGLLNLYYKDAINMLDDAQLLNTSIAQPFNFKNGFAYGAEVSVHGELSAHWSEFFNYTYEIAKGEGISGGIFAFPNGTQPGNTYQYLDHVQVHTANSGFSYKKDKFWWTTQGLYGSGLRTGPNNSTSLPGHFSMDTTVGYDFSRTGYWSLWKISADVTNIFDNVYPISVANGFNGSHYAAGREFFVHLTKEL